MLHAIPFLLELALRSCSYDYMHVTSNAGNI